MNEGFTEQTNRFWQDQLARRMPQAAPSLSGALALFDRLADMDLAFGYSQTGCQARAHLMCLEMIRLGHAPAKIWAFEDADLRLEFLLPGHDGVSVSWWFHVAPVLPVDNGDGQGPQPMVFDPGMFDGPVTPRQWAGRMRALPQNLHIVPLGQPAPGYLGDYLPYTADNFDDTEAYTGPHTSQLAQETIHRNQQYELPVRHVYASGLRPATGGITWRTLGYKPPPRPDTAVGRILDQLAAKRRPR